MERKSEFAGIPFEKQRQMIEKGKEILEGHNIKTNVFFAPANTYDKNTFKALRLNGYSIIPSSYTTMPYHDYGMLFLPGKYAEPVEAKGFVTIYLHTNTIKDDLYDKIDEFIKTHRDEVVNYSEFIHLGESTKAYFIPKIELGYYIIKNRLKRFVKKILYKGKR